MAVCQAFDKTAALNAGLLHLAPVTSICVTPSDLQFFHGEKELFRSSHQDQIVAGSIEGHCRVLSLADYQVRHAPARGFEIVAGIHQGLLGPCRTQSALDTGVCSGAPF